MKNFPKTRRVPIPPAQSVHTRQWLQEWTLLQEASMEAESAVGDVQESGMSGEAWAPFAMPEVDAFPEADPLPGEVRVLHPDSVPAADTACFVAYVGHQAGRPLVVPFSPFASPAFPGELLVDEDADTPMRVLCAWNAQGVSMSRLRQSWLAGKLPLASCREAYDLWAHFYLAQPFPAHLTDRVGMPVVDMFDPRRVYQREQRRTYAGLGVTEVESVPSGANGFQQTVASELQHAAAGAEAGYPLLLPDSLHQTLSGPLTANADVPFVVYEDQQDCPNTIWFIEGDVPERLRSGLAGRTVWLMLMDSQTAVARGRVNAEGTAIQMHELLQDPARPPIVEQHTLALLVEG